MRGLPIHDMVPFPPPTPASTASGPQTTLPPPRPCPLLSVKLYMCYYGIRYACIVRTHQLLNQLRPKCCRLRAPLRLHPRSPRCRLPPFRLPPGPSPAGRSWTPSPPLPPSEAECANSWWPSLLLGGDLAFLGWAGAVSWVAGSRIRWAKGEKSEGRTHGHVTQTFLASCINKSHAAAAAEPHS